MVGVLKVNKMKDIRENIYGLIESFLFYICYKWY